MKCQKNLKIKKKVYKAKKEKDYKMTMTLKKKFTEHY